jgi:hypothetical protein
MTDRAKSVLWKLAKASLGLAVFAWVVHSGRVSFEHITKDDLWLMVGGFSVLLLLPVVGWIRWWAVVRAQGISLGLFEAFKLQLIGIFFNAFLLGSVGGDALKVYYLAKGAGSEKKAAAVMTVGLDRFYGVVALFILMGSQIPFAWGVIASGGKIATILAVVAGIYLLGFVGVGVLLIPRLRERRRRRFARWSAGDGFKAKLGRALDHADEALQETVRKPRTTLFCVAVSFVGHMSTIVAFYLFGRALGSDDVGFTKYIVLAPLALAVTGLPILPLGGLGAGEWFASAVFVAVANVGKAFGGTVMFLWRMALLVPWPLGFLFFVIHRKEFARPEGESADAASADSGTPQAPGPSGVDETGGADAARGEETE